MLTPLEKRFFLKGVPMFAEVRDDYLIGLAQALEEVHVAAGDALFREGDPGDAMYVIVSGRIVVARDGNHLADLSRGECVGEMSLIDGMPRSATVTAVTDCRLLSIDGDGLARIMAAEVEVARGILRVLSRRLRAMLNVKEGDADALTRAQAA